MKNKLRMFFEFRIPLISYLLLFVVILVLFFFDYNFHSLSEKNSQVGAMILFAGFALRVLATTTMKYMGKIKITGVYAICRQPFLLAQIISFIGLNVIVCNSYFILASLIILICNDFLAYRKYDKILAHHYRDVWKIYAKHTNFLIPFTNRVKDVFECKLSQSELDNGQNAPIFFTIYAILVEIATFSNL